MAEKPPPQLEEFSLLRSDSELAATVSSLSVKAAHAAHAAAEAAADPQLQASDPELSGPAANRHGDSHEVWFEFITDSGSGGGGVRAVNLKDLVDRRGSGLVFRRGDEHWTTVSAARAEANRDRAGSASASASASGEQASADAAEQAKAAMSKGLSGMIGSRLIKTSSKSPAASRTGPAEPEGREHGFSAPCDGSVPSEGGGMTISRPFNVSKWTPSFGQPLEHCTTCQIHGFAIPRVLESLSQELRRRRGLKEEGIFRLAPDANECATAKKNLNMDPTAVGDDADVHVLANLIKVWFRELPVKILSSISQEEIAQCTTGAECMQVLQGFPPQRKGLVLWLLELMADVAEEQDENKMNERAIAIVIAPNLYEPDKNASPMEGVVFTQKMTKFLSELLFHYITVRQSVRRRGSSVDKRSSAVPACAAAADAAGHPAPAEAASSSSSSSKDAPTPLSSMDATFMRSGVSMTPQSAERMAMKLTAEGLGAVDDLSEEWPTTAAPAPTPGLAEASAASGAAEDDATRHSENFHQDRVQMGAEL